MTQDEVNVIKGRAQGGWFSALGNSRTALSIAHERVSQALAYVANEAGLDVEDYRSGKSQAVFARHSTEALFALAGAKNVAFTYEDTRKGTWDFDRGTSSRVKSAS